MKGNNPSRDLSKNASNTTTPVTYRNSAAVYRSLSAVPSALEVSRPHAVESRQFAPLVGPQSKNKGEVIWTESKNTANTQCLNSGARDPRPMPIPLIVADAPCYTKNSLYVESSPVSKVVSAVHDLFDQHRVDAQFDEGKFKWKCACYDSHVETRFVSQLYSVPDKPNYFVLDFQRRSGDPFHFQSIYKAINFRLLKSGFIVRCNDDKSNVSEPQMRTFKPLSLPASFFDDGCDATVTEEKDASDYEPICNMCISPYIDVQREGLSALASQMDQSEVARRCLASFSEKLIEAVSLSRDVQVRRLATAALAGLSNEKEAHRFVKGKGGLKVIATLLSDENEILETRRQAGRVLLNVSDWDSDIKETIRRIIPIAKDKRLLDIINDLQSRISV